MSICALFCALHDENDKKIGKIVQNILKVTNPISIESM